MENKKNIGKIVGALLVGTAVGGVLGILFAPNSGSETRMRISTKRDDVADYIKDKLKSLLEGLKFGADKSEDNVSKIEEKP